MHPVDDDLGQEDVVIATVGEREVSVDELVEHLRLSFNWNVMEGLFERILVESAWEEHDIEADDEEVDAFADFFRAQRGLLTAKETERWLSSRRMTAEDFYVFCECTVKEQKLKHSLFSDEVVRERFVMARGDYESVELYQIVLRKESKAREIAALIQDGESFFELAKLHSEDETTRKLCGYAGAQTRSGLRPELESRIYAASEGDVIGPIKSVGSYHLILIEKFHHAEFTAAVQEEIREKLFAAWKKERLDTTPIELCM